MEAIGGVYNRISEFVNVIQSVYHKEVKCYQTMTNKEYSIEIRAEDFLIRLGADSLNRVVSSLLTYQLNNTDANSIYEYACRYFRDILEDIANDQEEK